MLQDRLYQDLKTAMLSGDTSRTDTLKMLKSALLYKAIELDARDSGLSDEQVIEVLTKEAKKRLDTAQLYEKAGAQEKAADEKSEHQLISQYLPEQLSDDELVQIIDVVLGDFNNPSMAVMGQVIGAVKSRVGTSADGSRIAAVVKEKLA